jgi:protein ImuA
MTHEWFLDAQLGPDWRGPTLLMAWLAAGCHGPSAGRALETEEEARPEDGAPVAWIGRRSWPSPWILAKAGLRLDQCLFVDPRTEGERLWAIDQTLRCQGVSAVIADASGLDMGASRRLQLAAEAGGVLGLLIRPPPELKSLSAAATRWVITPHAAIGKMQWKVELRRCKAGALWAAASNGTREWMLEWTEGWKAGRVEAARETGGMRLAADVASGPGAPAARKTA